MKPTEAAALLTIAAAFDNRKPDADQAKAWALALDGLRFEDCRTAVVEHYKRTREWLMPSNVVDGVKRLRDKRLADAAPQQPPSDLDPDDAIGYQQWLRTIRQDIADGTQTTPPAIEMGEPRNMVAELGHIGREVPRA